MPTQKGLTDQQLHLLSFEFSPHVRAKLKKKSFPFPASKTSLVASGEVETEIVFTCQWRGCRHGKPLQLLGFCSLLLSRPRAEDTQEEKVDVVDDDWISDDDVYRLRVARAK